MMLFWTIMLIVIGIALLRLLPVESPGVGSSVNRRPDDSNRGRAEGDPTDEAHERRKHHVEP